MGGLGMKDSPLGDILLFHTSARTITTQVEDGDFKFSAPEN